MTQISSNMKKILSRTIIKEHPDDYSIVYIDPREEERARALLRNIKPYSSVTYTVDEVSVVLRSKEWEYLKESFKNYSVEGPYRLFTFDLVLDLSIVGFLSVISTVLADSGISIFAISTYLKDHILVRKGDAAQALMILNELVSSAKT